MSFFNHVTDLTTQQNDSSTALSKERAAGAALIAIGTKLLVFPPVGITVILGGIATVLNANAKRLG